MNKWKTVSNFIVFSTKGITPKYVETSSILVLNQKCIRNGAINYSFAQFTDDTKQIQASKFVQKGDILVNSTGVGTAGRCAFVSNVPENHRLIVDSHILILRCNSFYEAQCLSYLLFSFEQTLMSFMTGSSGQSELDKVVLLNLKVKLPPEPATQQKIAHVLSALDFKIELNNKINTELEAMAKMLYDYWFVQFDFPDIDGNPYKSSGGQMVWSEELKRKIPDGWKVEELKKHITIERGISYKGTEIQDTGTPMVNLNSFYLDGRYKDEGIKYFSGSVNDSKVIKAGDLMIATTDVTRNAYIIGKSFILPDLYAGQVVASCDIAKVCIGNELNKYYLDMLFNSDDYHKYIKGFASGTLVLHLDTKGIEWYKAVIPSKDVLRMFSDFKGNIDAKKTITLKENQTLSELRNWLLPMLMNGQVKVK